MNRPLKALLLATTIARQPVPGPRRRRRRMEAHRAHQLHHRRGAGGTVDLYARGIKDALDD
jgi:hypothetical protein